MASPLDKLNCKVFAEHLHTNFKIHLDGATPVLLELTAANEGEPSPRVEMFSLWFLGPQAPRLKQQIYHFEHEKLGAFDLFLTAIRAEAEGILYEAVFNRFRKETS